MNISAALKVRQIAEEVIALVDAAVDRARADREQKNAWEQECGREPFVGTPRIEGTKEAGALRRRSLDLTRALAEMRKP